MCPPSSRQHSFAVRATVQSTSRSLEGLDATSQYLLTTDDVVFTRQVRCQMLFPSSISYLAADPSILEDPESSVTQKTFEHSPLGQQRDVRAHIALSLPCRTLHSHLRRRATIGSGSSGPAARRGGVRQRLRRSIAARLHAPRPAPFPTDRHLLCTCAIHPIWADRISTATHIAVATTTRPLSPAAASTSAATSPAAAASGHSSGPTWLSQPFIHLVPRTPRLQLLANTKGLTGILQRASEIGFMQQHGPRQPFYGVLKTEDSCE